MLTEKDLERVPEELRELFRGLDAQGLNPEMCDTPVPYFACGIPCGSPRAVYENAPDGYDKVPRSLVGNDALVVARITGNSMRDAGFEEGDEIYVQLDAAVHDGDIVVACLDGECTVKGYLKDEEGQVWLVPRNRDYSPIRITEDMNARIVGRVVSHRKPAPRVSHSEMYSYIREQIEREASEAIERDVDTAQCLREALACAFEGLKVTSSDWIAAYRVLVDRAGAPTSFKAFAEYVNALDIASLPLCKAELLRKADPVYLRPVREWTPDMAPSVRLSILDKRASVARKLKELL